MSMKSAVKKFLPPGSRRFIIVKKIARVAGLLVKHPPDIKYAEWIEYSEPLLWSPRLAKSRLKVSIVVPVFNTPAEYFWPMVYSVVNQTYDNWELILVNASTEKKSIALTETAADVDARIKVVAINGNKGISLNTNKGFDSCKGDYIALLDHDDLLSPHALNEMICSAESADTLPCLIYSDEDKITKDGEARFDPHFKPDWSPNLLRHVNYINHFSMIKREVIVKIGGERSQFDGAQDYDLYLRAIDEDPSVMHVSRVLYHWRIADNSTASNFAAKDNITNVGSRAISEHLSRNKLRGQVKAIDKQPGFYEVIYDHSDKKSAAILIGQNVPPAQYVNYIKALVKSLARTSKKVDIIMNEPPEFDLKTPPNINIIFNEAVDTAKFLKSSIELTSATTLIFTDAAVLPCSKYWLDKITGQLEQEDKVGAMCPLLIDNGLILSAGKIEIQGIFIDLFEGQAAGSHTYFGNSDWSRDVDSVNELFYAFSTKNAHLFYDSYTGSVLDHNKLSKLMKQNKKQVVTNGSLALKYHGAFNVSPKKSRFFNEALVFSGSQISLPRVINLPQETDDER